MVPYRMRSREPLFPRGLPDGVGPIGNRITVLAELPTQT